MKNGITLILVVLLSAGCTSVQKTQKPAFPTPELKCNQGVCVSRAFVTIQDSDLLFEFDLRDPTGQASIGQNLQIRGQITVGIFRLNEDGSDTFLIGFKSVPKCYSGNDIPWMQGKYGYICSVTWPLSQMETRAKPGDTVRLEIIENDFKQVLSISQGK